MTPRTNAGVCHGCRCHWDGRWRTGPDGFQTLCNTCSQHYAAGSLTVYQDVSGKVTANRDSGGRALRVIGFRRNENSKRDMLRPITRPLHLTEVGTKAITSLPSDCLGVYEKHRPRSLSTEPSGNKSQETLPINRCPVCGRKGGYPGSNGEETLCPYCIVMHGKIPSSRRADLRPQATFLSNKSAGDVSREEIPKKTLRSARAVTMDRNEICTMSKDTKHDQERLENRSLQEDAGSVPIRDRKLPLKVRCELGAQKVIRRFRIGSKITGREFKDSLRRRFGLKSEFCIRYRDEDNDEVIATFADEIAEMLTLAFANNTRPMTMEIDAPPGLDTSDS